MSQLLWDVVRAGFGKQNDITLDTQILRFHSRLSFRILVISSLLLTFKQVIGGDDISCFEDVSKEKDENLNAYCWIQSTYSVVELFRSCRTRKDCVYPGVGQYHPDRDFPRFHTYYQWTSAALFFHGVLFYIPRFIWKCVENGLQKMLAYDRKLMFYPITSVETDDQKIHLRNLILYFKTHQGHHQFYFIKYCCCEILGMIFVVVNMILTNLLLGNQFFSFGFNVVHFWLTDNGKSEDVSPMIKVFPLVAKCTSPKRFGPGGNIISPDPLCVLPLNSINDKIFFFLWFYLIFALSVSVLALMYRMCTFFFTTVRIALLRHNAGTIKHKVIKDIGNRSYIGDWFVMYIMSNNVSKEFFREFLEGLWEEMFQKRHSV